MRISVAIALGTLLCACGAESGPQAASSTDASPPAAPERTVAWRAPEHPVSDAELGRICRATVAATMGRPVEIISVDRSSGGEADVRYTREEDRSVWKTRCRIDGDRVTWRGIDAFGPGSGLGRWRDGPYDSRITVAIFETRIRITETFEDGVTVHEIDVPE